MEGNPDNYILAAHCGYLGVVPQSFSTEWKLQKKVLAIVDDNATAIDARMASSFFAGILLWAAKMKLAHDWAEILDLPQNGARIREFHRCLSRNAPFGSQEWRAATAERLAWSRGIRRPGRPRTVRLA